MNCSQIFCTFAVETTLNGSLRLTLKLWIALKFFVLLQSKQLLVWLINDAKVVNCSQIFCTFAVETTFLSMYVLQSGCELLSNFLYFCSRNNKGAPLSVAALVVNCSQIFCTFAVETTPEFDSWATTRLWIALKFFVLLQSKQLTYEDMRWQAVVNCSQIFCTFAVETTALRLSCAQALLWIALKFFVLLQSKQHSEYKMSRDIGCELLSNFLYFCSRNNWPMKICDDRLLWIALKFFVLLQSKQPRSACLALRPCCELLSNFLYFCSRNNTANTRCLETLVVNCSQIFCTFAVETTVINSPLRLYPLWIALKFFVLLQSKQLTTRAPAGV